MQPRRMLWKVGVTALALAGVLRAVTIIPNKELDLTGPLGPSVTTLAIGDGPSAAQDWLQSAVFPGSFITTQHLVSTDPLPGAGGNMLRVITDGLFTGSAGNGIGVNFIGVPLPVGSIGTVDILIESPGTSGLLGWVVNTGGGTAFDLGSVFFGPGPAGVWQRLSFTNQTTPTGTFELEIFSHAPGALGNVLVDHLAFTAVPEPATMALVGVALLALGAMGRRR